jgi:S-adenosylmethionine/arginine decarboxylase-like enzyme
MLSIQKQVIDFHQNHCQKVVQVHKCAFCMRSNVDILCDPKRCANRNQNGVQKPASNNILLQQMWGYHYILNLGTCNPKAIRNPTTIARFAKTLVRKIDMVAYGEPQVQHFGSGNKAGYTMIQLIETSNICAHFVEETNDIYLDVFSCKPFEASEVDTVVKFFFQPQRISRRMILRDANKEPQELK